MKVSKFEEESKRYRSRFDGLTIIIIIAFTLIMVRLWYLQILKGDEFLRLSREYSIKIRTIPASRGMILDRYGATLVDNIPSFDVLFIPEYVDDHGPTLTRLGEILGIDPLELENTIEKSRALRPFDPIRLLSGIDRDRLTLIETHRLDLPGIVIDIQPLRYYPFGSMTAHLLGYVGEISKKELRRKEYQDYKWGEVVGKTGTERKWNEYLRGRRGGRQVEVDAVGRETRTLSKVEPTPGANLILTIDSRLQETVEECLSGKVGSIIAMDPVSGEIFAMAAAPSFDSNLFAGGLSTEQWGELINDPLHPLENKAIRGQYPPGSTYKILVALAVLKEGIVTPETTFSCPGFYRFGRRTFRCWKSGGHGEVDLHQAVVQSCDVYFYQMGEALGVDLLASYALSSGFGQPTGIRLFSEKPGLIPTRRWKKRTLGEVWYPGETIPVSIGQGYNLVTPLQLVTFISAVINGGTLWIPRVVLRVEDVEGKTLYRSNLEKKGILPFSMEHLELMKLAMGGVVREKKGTAHWIAMRGLQIGGKTGTVQVISEQSRQQLLSRLSQDDQHSIDRFEDHAWFVGFASVEEPEVTVVVIIEHGGHGSTGAAPLAKKVIKRYFELKEERLMSVSIERAP